ncbi:unnamed protein product [Sympodiomycopsis kandeliae]
MWDTDIGQKKAGKQGRTNAGRIRLESSKFWSCFPVPSLCSLFELFLVPMAALQLLRTATRPGPRLLRRPLLTNINTLTTSSSALQRQSLLDVSPEVEAAIHSKDVGINKIVALESTIITHGMPYPTNLEAAQRVEKAVRSQGAVPATIAVIDGRIKVGLSESELRRVAESPLDKTRKAIKAGRRELAYVCGQKDIIGGTTVSGTSAVCNLAGIYHFATGGIGGVHRGAESTMDISADLVQLGKAPINIFCSGAKSILDIPRTLEFLETHSVAVYSLNPTGEFPAFFTSKSGHFVPAVSDIDTIARIMTAGKDLDSEQATIWAVPIPSEYEEKGALIQRAVEQAVQESKEQGIDKKGKESTPWLLARVNELTKGESLKSNVELVVNNATWAAKSAVKWAQLEQQLGYSNRTANKGPFGAASQIRGIHTSSTTREAKSDQRPDLVVMGCAALDITTHRAVRAPKSTSPGRIEFNVGGVACNIARAAKNVLDGYQSSESIGVGVKLVAPIRNDIAGNTLRGALDKWGLGSNLFHCKINPDATISPTEFSGGLPLDSSSTPTVLLNLDADNDLIDGVASTDLVEAAFGTRTLRRQLEKTFPSHKLSPVLPHVVVIDGNLSQFAMSDLLRWRLKETPFRPSEEGERGDTRPRHLIFETTSTAKCVRMMHAMAYMSKQFDRPHKLKLKQPMLDIMTPNLLELEEMVRVGIVTELINTTRDYVTSFPQSDDGEKEILKRAQLLCQMISPLVYTTLVTLGPLGVFSCHTDTDNKLVFLHHKIDPNHLTKSIVSTTGAGDSFTGAVAAYAVLKTQQPDWKGNDSLLCDEQSVKEAVTIGQLSSACTLESTETVETDNMVRSCGTLMAEYLQTGAQMK